MVIATSSSENFVSDRTKQDGDIVCKVKALIGEQGFAQAYAP